MSDEHIIRTLNRDPETGGFVFEFLTPSKDIRNNGLVINHALLLPPEDRYLPLIDEIEQALQQWLTTVLALFEDGEPEVVDDGEENPYDNPEER